MNCCCYVPPAGGQGEGGNEDQGCAVQLFWLWGAQLVHRLRALRAVDDVDAYRPRRRGPDYTLGASRPPTCFREAYGYDEARAGFPG
eukprot:1185449-Prorocentrum_minimum.AAC.1